MIGVKFSGMGRAELSNRFFRVLAGVLTAALFGFDLTLLAGTGAGLESVRAFESAGLSAGAWAWVADWRALDLRGAGTLAPIFLTAETDFLGGACRSGTTVSGVLSGGAGGEALFFFMAWLSGLRSGF